MPESTFPVIGTSISSSRASLGNASLPAINDTRSSQQKTYSMEIGVLSPLPCRATQVRKQGKRLPTKKRRSECCALQWRDIDREQLNIHSLRHTAASLMIAGGADMATVAGILGHSQLSATLDIYTHARTKKPPARSCKECWRYRVHQQKAGSIRMR